MLNLTEEQIKQEIEIGKKLNKISQLKQYLSDTDYKAIKFAEGELTEEEYAETKTQRKSWREEINKLEEELKNGNNG